MKQQRILGVFLIVLSLVIVAIAAQGSTVEERDVTAVLFLLPLGVYAICTKTPITYAAQAEAEERKKRVAIRRVQMEVLKK